VILIRVAAGARSVQRGCRGWEGAFAGVTATTLRDECQYEKNLSASLFAHKTWELSRKRQQQQSAI